MSLGLPLRMKICQRLYGLEFFLFKKAHSFSNFFPLRLCIFALKLSFEEA